MFFTGSWRDFFSAEETQQHGADVVGVFVTVDASWYFKDCIVGATDECLVQTLWPLLRLSRWFATILSAQLSAGVVAGHHEAIIAPVCDADPRCVRMPMQRRPLLLLYSRYLLYKVCMPLGKMSICDMTKSPK